MPVLFATHPAYLEHLTGPGHPERPSRMEAVLAGSRNPAVADALVALEPLRATRADLERVHPAWYLDRLEEMAAVGGGWIDADTRISTALQQREMDFVAEANGDRSTMLVPLKSSRGHDLGWVGLTLPSTAPQPKPEFVRRQVEALANTL